ncbi:hypothetical protein [Aliiruegeria lutimaris]|uniref:Uncharacterized protein n=1 Tax=Aliiruegeria lutimaris TaxID=571298 RepID=A0A1G9IBS6_9RHOB|nr:hypothetical protein [Aliiruegeria lutimaris]SDL22659.1 hypothetical protein SAMN04488026_107328 [Aliiruegeria lutimaris]
MFEEWQWRPKVTVLVAAIGCAGILFTLVYAVSSREFRACIDHLVDEAFGSAIEVVRHKQSGEYIARLPGGRLVKLSGREEAEAIAEHGYSACKSCR